MANEYTATSTTWTISAQILHDGSRGIGGQRQLFLLAAFPAHCDACVFPINVFQIEPDYFTRPQPKMRQ